MPFVFAHDKISIEYIKPLERELNMRIRIIKARSGDCFVVDFENGHCILIDCGYSQTYNANLKPYLEYLNSKGKVLDYVILTHYDEDHISGLIEFFCDNGTMQRVISIGEIIVNGFSAIACDQTDLKQVSPQKRGIDIEKVSSKQEYSFEKYCIDNGYPINRFKGGKSILAGDSINCEDYRIKFVSPSQEQLDQCYENLLKLLKDKGYYQNIINLQNTAINLQEEDYLGTGVKTEKVAGYQETDIQCWTEDPAPKDLDIVNQASLAFEIIHGNYRLLFCGDADMVTHRDDLSVEFYDLIKLSHHGTVRGNECFIGENHIQSDKYLISTDAHRKNREHPSRQLLGKIITEEREKKIKLCFNYDITRGGVNPDYSLLKDKEQQDKYQFDVDLNCDEIVFQ